jgi:DNA topoisomerase-2
MAIITELPIETWTADFRETLDKLLTSGIIKDYTDTSTDTDILIKIKLGTGGVPAIEKLMIQKLKLTNMHAFNSKNVIHKYESPNAILKEFVSVRLELYKKRREFMLKTLKEKLPYHTNIVRFIKQQCQDPPLPDLRRQTPEECDTLLSQEKFNKLPSYDYLLDLPIKSLTLKHAQKHQADLDKLELDISNLEKETPINMWKKELKLMA